MGPTKPKRRCLLMPAWVWVLIGVVVVVVLAIAVWQAMARRRTGHLQDQFGPEYDRTVGSADSKRDAEAELQAREDRRQQIPAPAQNPV